VKTFWRTNVDSSILEDHARRIRRVLDQPRVDEMLAHVLGHIPRHGERRRGSGGDDPSWVLGIC